MAYNYYQPYPYQQAYYQPTYTPQPTQPVVQQQQQSYQTPISQSGIVWISGEQEAAMYPIAPNNAVALWEKSGKTIYLKSADATGKPTMRVYDLVERTETPSEASSADSGKLPTYATKDELAAVLGLVKGFDELVGGLKSDIETMKGDMYGIAGKKKTKKTVEVEEDE